MVSGGGSGVTTETKAMKLAWGIFKGLNCQTWEGALYVIGRRATKIS